MIPDTSIRNISKNNYCLFETITFENTQSKKITKIAFGSRLAFILRKLESIGHALTRGHFFNEQLEPIQLSSKNIYMYQSALEDVKSKLLPKANSTDELFKNYRKQTP